MNDESPVDAGSREAGRESGNDALNKCRELMNLFEQRLRLDDLRLAQRYVESKLHVLVKFRIRGIDEEFIARFQREENVRWPEEGINGGELQAVERVAWVSGVNTSEHLAGMRPDIDASIPGPNREQQTVLLDVVQLVQNPEAVIPSLVGFNRVDCIECLLPRTLHFSLLFGFIFLGAIENRKVYPVGFRRTVLRFATDDLVGKMVEGAPKIVNCIPGEQGQRLGSGFSPKDIIDRLARVRIALDSDFIGVRVEEGPDTAIEITDVIFGPFDF